MKANLYNDKRYSNVESSSAGQQFVTPVQTHVQTDAPRQRVGQQKPGSAPRMPKAQAQALSRNLKKATTVASILGFGAFSGLIAYHQVNAATTATTTTTQSSTKASQSNSNSGSFFKQGKESNVGSSSTAQSSKSASTSNSNGSTQSTTSGASNSTTAPATGTSAS